MTDFDSTWQAIVNLEGETFYQKSGKPFTYRIQGGHLIPSTTNRQLPRSQFQQALERTPLQGPGQLKDLQGPSYLYAVLTDPRVTS